MKFLPRAALTGFLLGAVLSAPSLAVEPTISSITPSTSATGASLTAAAVGTGFDATAAVTLERFGVNFGTWTYTGALSTTRIQAGTAVLQDGRVMVAGGYQQSVSTSLTSVDLYDPVAGTWTATAPMLTARLDPVLVALKDGRVLAAGGALGPSLSETPTAEIYDPTTSTWTATVSMSTGVLAAPAVLLSDGRVLVAGGATRAGLELTIAQIYDPTAGTWSVSTMPNPHGTGSATTLADGRVLVAGGSPSNSVFTPAADIFNPVTNTWTSVAPLAAARQYFGQALLPDGRVLAAGGTALSGPMNTTEIYDPTANVWTAGPNLSVARRAALTVAVDGRVLVIGGTLASGTSGAVDVYDPATNTITPSAPLQTPRDNTEPPVRLGDGRVLVPGGYNTSGNALSSVELLTMPVASISATGVSVPDAQHLSGSFNLAGATTGYWDVAVRESGSRAGRLSAGFQIRPAAITWVPSVASISPSSAASASTATASVTGATLDGTAAVTLERFGVNYGTWTFAAPLSTTRIGAGTAVLKDGRVMVAGGYQQSVSTSLASVDLYDPVAGTWSAAAPMHVARENQVLVTLKDGRVLAAGGQTGPSLVETPTAEIYDPAADAWTGIVSMSTGVLAAPAILLSDGRVLIAGGATHAGLELTIAQVYDPTAGTWTNYTMPTAHGTGSIVTLADGRVMVAGGSTANSVFTAATDIFTPGTNTWFSAAALAAARQYFGLALLPDGRVLAAGGTALSGVMNTTEIYDPTANTWTAGPNLSVARRSELTVAVDGRVLVIGGTLASGTSGAVDVYDPTTNAFTPSAPLQTARDNSVPPVQLGDGRVLVPGGYNTSGNALSSVELLTMPVSSITLTSVSVPDSQHLSGSLSLTGATTGYWDVAVRESGSRAGRLSAGFLVSLPAAIVPPPFSGASLGTSSIAWSWSLIAGATSYHVFDTTGADKSGQLSAATTTWIETGLTANTAYGRLVGDFSQFFSSYSASTSVFTAAAPPTGSALSSIFSSSATLTWAANGNPAATIASVERSTDAASYSQVYSSAVLTFTDSGLSSCTSYYYRVRNRSGVGVPTAYDAVKTAFTLGITPSPPDALTAQALSGGLVSLSWLASPSSGLTGYHLYASTGALSYAAPYATIAPGTTGYTTPALSTGTVYRFGLRAFACGLEETNTNVVASATPLADASGLSAAIKVPESGKKVAGNSVTVMADIVSGDASRVTLVRFQYRTAASTTAAWSDIPAADSQHPNPATTAPYFIHWDVTGLANGSYELRAIAAASGYVDPAPATVVIGVDAVVHDTNENIVAGSVKKDETVYNGAQRVVSVADSASGAVAAVTMPSGAVTASTDTLSVQVNPAGAPGPSKSQTSLGQVLQLSLGSGQTSLNGAASITMTYQDANNTGVVDGTAIRVDRLAILTYNVASGQWRQESTTVVDKNAKTVTATTPHFSLFGLFATASTNLSSVLVYPVPWLPNAGDPNTGKPFSSGDATSGIVFDGVTDSVRIQIFTASGALVWDRSVSGSGGRVQWDGRNTNGRDAASGGYLAVITDLGGGGKIVRKIAIIR